MTYLAQYKPHGCRNWRDLGKPTKYQSYAMAYLVRCGPGVKRVRILAIPPTPKSVAEAFYSEPKVIFEGEFK